MVVRSMWVMNVLMVLVVVGGCSDVYAGDGGKAGGADTQGEE